MLKCKFLECYKSILTNKKVRHCKILKKDVLNSLLGDCVSHKRGYCQCFRKKLLNLVLRNNLCKKGVSP